MKTLYRIFGIVMILGGGYGIFVAFPTVSLDELIMLGFSAIVMVIGGFVMAKGLRRDRRENVRGFEV